MSKSILQRTLEEAIVERSKNLTGHPDDWDIWDWAGAMAGEAGEAVNWAVKMHRARDLQLDEESFKAELVKEVADTITYAIILCDRLGVDVNQAVWSKFNEVSARWGHAQLPPL